MSCKANFKVLGARFGKDMKLAAAKIASLSGAEIGKLVAGGKLAIELPDGRSEEIGADDLVIRRDEKPGMVAASENGVTIALATELTPELVAEGMARELVSKIQNIRKEKDFDVTDRINVTYDAPAEAGKAFGTFRDYIAGEVLAAKFAPGAGDTALDVNGVEVKVTVEKA